MKQLTFLGHPLHPQIIAGPLGLLPFSFVMDILHLATRRQCYADAAYYSMVGGYASGLAAGATGAADYLTISPGGPMKQAANTHAIINLSTMALYTINLAMRRRRSSGFVPAMLSAIGTVGISIAQWYGGDLVYKHGMRVEPATQRKQPEARLPGDEAVEHRLHRLAEMVPAGGPGSEQ